MLILLTVRLCSSLNERNVTTVRSLELVPMNHLRNKVRAFEENGLSVMSNLVSVSFC